MTCACSMDTHPTGALIWPPCAHMKRPQIRNSQSLQCSEKHACRLMRAIMILKAQYTSSTYCDTLFGTAKRVIPKILDSIEIKLLQKFFCKCWQYMDAYEFEF